MCTRLYVADKTARTADDIDEATKAQAEATIPTESLRPHGDSTGASTATTTQIYPDASTPTPTDKHAAADNLPPAPSSTLAFADKPISTGSHAVGKGVEKKIPRFTPKQYVLCGQACVDPYGNGTAPASDEASAVATGASAGAAPSPPSSAVASAAPDSAEFTNGRTAGTEGDAASPQKALTKGQRYEISDLARNAHGSILPLTSAKSTKVSACGWWETVAVLWHCHATWAVFHLISAYVSLKNDTMLLMC